ncbi:putative disease resistance protein At4g11170 isoform X2 [Eutrema salsugineum]|nr:putative disease resistance protein At4g11170 isoform X2 [Eutrema salsugineum]
MADPSSSFSTSWRYDVFASFRGEDVRKNFLSHLLKEFENKGIVTFRDDQIERSHSIGPELVEAIRESKISLVLFSENYASSSWCLDELVEILKCKEEQRLKVMPIFYKVDPSDVRKQTGKFGMCFWETCYGKTEEKQRSWRQALTDAASIVGDHSQDWDNEANMITKIAKDVLNKLNVTPSRDFSDLVGIEAHIAKMNTLLCLASQEGRMVGIWGPAGIGKTTIARALYNQIQENFKLSIFMENVSESYGETNLDDYGLKLRLQQNFLSKLLDQHNLRIRHLGAIEERLKNQKVLIVLDDVDNIEQLKALAKETQWFGNKSRIIVTTRNKQLLISHGINHIYKVAFPSREEALAIFSQHAFKELSPSDDFKDLAIEFATIAGHLPLGLRVFGSFMRGQSKDEWEASLPTLKTRLDGEIEKVLRVGYDGLHKDDKALFLHIACLFNGHHETYVKQMVVANNELDISFGLKVLADRSLIQIYENGTIMMHSLLQQLGREVVREQSLYEPGKRQFLMNAREICGVLSNNTVTETVLGMSVDMCDFDEDFYISEKAFENMRNLIYIRFYRSNEADKNKMKLPEEGLGYLPQLRLMQWDAYPHVFLPSRFRTECLVELNMSHSKLKMLWGDNAQPLRSLRFMDLSKSQNLEVIPNLLEATNLERLDLSWCESLVELPSSIKNLHKLTRLEMSCCTNLEIIPTNINLASLSHLHFRYCHRLKTFPEISTNITYLKIKGTAITEVPPSVRSWRRIEEICMERTKVKRLVHVPYILDALCLRGNTQLVSITNYLTQLRRLRMIDISFCVRIVSLPKLPNSVHHVTALN